MLDGEKVLITGATGKIAFPIARALAERNDVWGAARLKRPAARDRLEAAGVTPFALDMADPFPLRLIEAEGNDDDLEARFEDVHPEIGESLRLRLTNWCSRLLGRMLKVFEERYRVPR